MRKVKGKKVEPHTPEIIFDEVAPEVPRVEENVFGEEEEEAIAVIPTSEVVEVDLAPDLAEIDRKEIAAALRAEIPVAERAKLLSVLARMKDTKRAATGLRALQVINELTGVTEATKTDAPPMFMLPDGVSVEVKVQKVEK